jgi:hypothetical protein
VKRSRRFEHLEARLAEVSLDQLGRDLVLLDLFLTRHYCAFARARIAHGQ